MDDNEDANRLCDDWEVVRKAKVTKPRKTGALFSGSFVDNCMYERKYERRRHAESRIQFGLFDPKTLSELVYSGGQIVWRMLVPGTSF